MVKLRGEEALVRAEQGQRELKVNIAVSERLIGEAQARLDRSRALIARGADSAGESEPQRSA